nr:ubiquitin hydrolase [Tanacetum cinerariifolium]
FESASKDLDTLLGSQRSDKNKEGLGYSVVPPPAQVYSPPKKDMSWTGLPKFTDDTITDYSRPSPTIESNSSDLQSSNSSVSEHGESSESIMSKPMIKFVKAADCRGVIKNNKTETARKPPVKYVEMYRNTTKSLKVRGNQRNWNNLMNQILASNFEFKNKACYECGSFDHLIKDCSVHQKQEMEKPVWNNARRVNHQNSPKITHPNLKRHMDPRKNLTRDKIGRFSEDKKSRGTKSKEVVDYILQHQVYGRIVGNKMLKSFPLPVMKFLLPEYFPTASEKMIPLLSQRDAPAEEVCTA